MSKVIEVWLKRRLGYCIQIEAETLGDILYDGVIFYNILKSYNIITSSSLPPPKKDPGKIIALNNLVKLCPWLKLLGVTHSQGCLEEIASRNGSTGMRLLFELYVKLEDKDSIYLITKQRESAIINEQEGRFVINKATEKIKPKSISNRNEHLERCLADNQEMIAKYKDYKTKLEKKCKEESRLRRMKLIMEQKPEIIINEESTIKEDLVFDFVKNMASKRKDAKELLKCTPKKYVEYLKLKRRKSQANESLRMKLQDMLLHDLWSALLAQQEEEFHAAFREKLIQQSEYEKKLATKLVRSHYSYRSFSDQKRGVEENLNVNNTAIVANEYMSMRGEDINFEQERVQELHNRLYQEKLRVKHESHLEMCREIVRDLIDFGIKFSEFKQENKEQPSRWVINDWKELFFKEIPFYNDSHIEIQTYYSEEMGEEYEFIENLSSYDFKMLCDGKTVQALNKYSLHSYLNLVGEWNIENWPSLIEKSEEKLNIISHIVHRLLEHKYPFPDMPKPPDFNFQVKAILGPIVDHTIYNLLSHLLEKSNVELVDINKATNYCLGVYKLEASMTKIREHFKKSLTARASKSRKSRASNTSQRRATGKKGRKDKSKKQKPSKSQEIPIDKTTQFPSIQDFIVQMKHSPAGFLGKIALESLNAGGALDDVLACKMLIEYLCSIKDKKGFVLVNYPITVTQAALLEFLLTGKKISTNVKIDSDVDLFMTKLANPPLTVETDLLMKFDNELINIVQECSDVVLREENVPMFEHIEQPEIEIIEEIEEIEQEPEQIREEKIVEKNKRSTKVRQSKKSKKSLANRKASNTKKRSKSRLSKSKSRSRSRSASKSSKKSSKSSMLGEIDYKIDEELEEEDFEEIEEEEYVEPVKKRTITYDELVALRTSEILPKLGERNNELNYTSYFSKYLHVTHENMLPKKDKKGEKKDVFVESPDVKPEDFYRSINSLELLEVFDFDFASILKLARILLKSELNNIEEKTSKELFGAEALDLVAKKTNNYARLTKPRTSRRDSVKDHSRVGVSRSSTRSIKARSSKSVSIAPENPSIAPSWDEEPRLQIETLTPPRPGEDNWVYTNGPIPHDLMVALASIWETVENVYKTNLIAVFNLTRDHTSKLLPYRNFVRKVAEDCLNIPDDREQLVTNFQLMYNEIDDDFRRDPDLKADLHCRVYELYNILCDISDSKKDAALDQKSKLINQNWIAHYVRPLVNLYLCIMQLEVDRFIDTLQIINDYYISSLESTPDEKRLEKVIIKKVHSESAELQELTIASKKKKSEKMDKNDKNMKELTDTSLSLINIVGRQVSPAFQQVGKASSLIASKIKYVQQQTKSLINSPVRGKDTKLLKFVRNAQSKVKTSASSNASRRSRSKVNSINDRLETGLDNNTVDLIKAEWETALINEVERMNFRLELILEKSKTELTEVTIIMNEVFKEFEADIIRQYNIELNAIEALCNVFQHGIEDETKIQPRMIFNQNGFFIDKGSLLFLDPPPPPPTPLTEVLSDYIFTMEQLTNFTKKMYQIAPDGVIEGVLVDILEDMSIFSREHGNPYVPIGWSKLNRDDIKDILSMAFGDSGIFNWRDFVIFGMNIPMPSIQELADLKKCYQIVDSMNFETISYEQYLDIPLWFTKNLGETIQHDLHFSLAKELIFKLFQVSKTRMNYSLMLLAFSKGQDSLEGLLNALQLINTDYLLMTDEEFLMAQKEKIDAHKVVDQVIFQIIHDTILLTEGVVIKTLPRHSNLQIYGSSENEFEESERILAQIYDTESERYLIDRSSTSSMFLPKALQTEDDEIRYPERFQHPKWKICVPYNTALTLLTVSLTIYSHEHAMPEHLHRFLDIERRLERLYKEMGDGKFLKAYILATSDLFKDIFEQFGAFKMCHLDNLVEKYVLSKQTELTI